jgi:acetyl esterase/lipase
LTHIQILLLISVACSGGNLATAISLKASTAEPPISIRALIAIVAPFDNTATRESESWKQVSHPPVLGHAKAEKYREYYLGQPESPTFRGAEWLASPLLAPPEILRHCPPMLLLVAGVDTYYAEGIEFYEKVQKLGVSVELRVYQRAVHSFILMDGVLPSGRQGMNDMVDFLKRKIEEYSQAPSRIC